MAGVGVAYPQETEWGNSNQEPYCETCWQKEDEILEQLGAAHKGKGDKTPKSTNKKEKVVTKNAKNKPKKK